MQSCLESKRLLAVSPAHAKAKTFNTESNSVKCYYFSFTLISLRFSHRSNAWYNLNQLPDLQPYQCSAAESWRSPSLWWQRDECVKIRIVTIFRNKQHGRLGVTGWTMQRHKAEGGSGYKMNQTGCVVSLVHLISFALLYTHFPKSVA